MLPFTTLAQVVRRHAEARGDAQAFTFLIDGESATEELTYAEIDQAARGVGAFLRQQGAAGKPVMLVFPPGTGFLTGFLGCLYAGAVAVPTYPPDPRRLPRTLPRFQAIVADCSAEIALTTAPLRAAAGTLAKTAPSLSQLRWLALEEVPSDAAATWDDPGVRADDMAFLQYTSGSTGVPKGVIVTHRSLLLNVDLLARAWGVGPEETSFTWLPNYHDMGLIDGLLRPLWAGSHGVVMSPVDFLRKPVLWLRHITAYRAAVSGGPNFAYELCVNKVTPAERVGLDLSSWRSSYNGAEPVRPSTVAAFSRTYAEYGYRPEAHQPGYGMAEAVLIISAGSYRALPVTMTVSSSGLAQHRVVEAAPGAPDSVTLVSSGRAYVERAVIACPVTRRLCPPDVVGEIWVAGPSLSSGYWRRPEETAETFAARLSDTGDGPFLRTGDLGFKRADGELFITGRFKDLILVRGVNHYPQDIELTVEQTDPAALKPGCNAAFSVDVNGQERLVILQEIQRRSAGDNPHWRDRRVADPAVEAFAPTLEERPRFDRTIEAIRAAVTRAHDLVAYAVVLIKPGTIHKTSSGKIQRHACKAAFLRGELEVVADWRAQVEAPVSAPPPEQGPLSRQDRKRKLVEVVAARLRVAGAIDWHKPFAAYGLDSLEAVRLVADLEANLGERLPPTLLYDYPTLDALANFLQSLADAVEPRRVPALAVEEREPIAVVGIGCRFPRASSPAAFWDLLRRGVDATGEVPADRWDASAFYDPSPNAPGKAITKRGGFLDSVADFDAAFFGISAREATAMDPQQRILMEVAVEALDDAGIPLPAVRGSRTGVFVGIAGSDYGRRLFSDRRRIDAFFATGSAFSIAANRLSYFLDARGPSLAVDTACSASLVAVHLALQSLRSGECSMAIVGGVNVILAPDVTINFTKAGILAPDGRCKPFDASADGIARSEGAGAIVLKPLRRARADGDRIYALLAGSAVNSDGRSNGLMAPNGLAQQAVLREAYRDAGVAPRAVEYVEAHGTGTILGDPIEVGALAAVLDDGRPLERPLAIGSVKSNLGHLEPAAGVAGLIKVALAMAHGELPPTINFHEPNPHIPFARIPVRVQRELQAWRGPDRVAGVSAFGFGGTNAHVVVRPAPSVESRPADGERLYPIVLSAGSSSRLQATAAAFEGFAAESDAAVRDVAFTALTRREHASERLCLVARSLAEAATSARAYREGRTCPGLAWGEVSKERRVVFVFCGQGPQWWGMGRELIEAEPRFRRTIERCDELFRQLGGWSLLEVLGGDQRRTMVHDTRYTQCALFALQVGLAGVLREYGVEPDAVVGHSAGEMAAACVAGALTLEGGARLAFHRSRLMLRASGKGAMAVVELSMAEASALAARFEGRLSVAADNGPRSCVVSGDPDAVAEALAELETRGVFCRQVKVEVAGHSPHMDALAAELAMVLSSCSGGDARLPMLSTVTAQPATTFDARYWGRNLREPVRFREAIQALLDSGHCCFVELSPHPVLLEAIRQIGQGCQTLPTLHREHGERRTLLGTLGALHCRGVPVRLGSLFDSDARVVTIPATAFERQRYWLESVSCDTGDEHPLLAHLREVPGEALRSWEQIVRLEAVPFVRDHRVMGLPVLPGTGYLEMALAAAGGGAPLELADVSFRAALCLDEGEALAVSAVSTEPRPGQRLLRILSRPAQATTAEWTLHASATVVRAQGSLEVGRLDLDAIRTRATESWDAPRHYAAYHARRIDYGPAFQGVERVLRRDGEALGEVVLPESCASDAGRFVAHPALLDACLQVMGPALPSRGGDETVAYMPVAVERFHLFEPLPPRVLSHAMVRTERPSEDTHEADVSIADDQGKVLALVRGLRVKRVEARELSAEESRRWVYELAWREQPRSEPTAKEPASWLVFAPEDAELPAKLRATGEQVDAHAADAGDAAAYLALLARLPVSRDARVVYALDSAGGLLSLAQAMAFSERQGPLLWVLTERGQAVTCGDATGATPMRSVLWGLGRTLAHEIPGCFGGLIDLECAADLDRAIAEVRAAGSEDQVAFRRGARMVPRLLERRGSRAPAPLRCRSDGLYLITGGLGALGLMVARRLVERGAGHLLLTSRSGYLEREAWPAAAKQGDARASALLAMSQRAEVRIAAADVSDERAMAALLDAQGAPLTGVVHAAGVVSRRSLGELDREELHRVTHPKTAGAWALHLATRSRPLDFFVMFSSASGIWGSKLLAHYGAANAFLDGLAHLRRAQELPALSVDWAMWGEAGMASDEASREVLQRSGQKPMAPSAALDVLERLLSEDATQRVVASVDWPRFKGIFEQQPRRKLFDEIRVAPAAQAEADVRFVERLATQANTEERRAALRSWVLAEVAAVLGVEPSAVRDDAPLPALGLDSVMATELRGRLEAGLGLRVNVLSLLRGEPVSALVDTLHQQLDSAPAVAAPSIAEEHLDPAVRPTAPARSGPPKTWLLTGTTGFLGSFVLAELARRTPSRIYCLVRARDDREARGRLQRSLVERRLWDERLRDIVVPLAGDLSTEKLGLRDAQWEALAREVDAICHMGCLVNFLFGYADLRQTNVLGTQEVLRLSVTGQARPVHHVSSFSVFLTDEHTGKELGENDKAYPGPGGYRETKRMGERLVTEARARGVPASVYRPPFIGWHSVTGVANEQDFVIRLLRGCLSLGAAPEIDLLLHLAPVDHVSRTMVRLMELPAALGQDFNLVVDERGTPWRELVELLRRAGRPLSILPYDEWLAAVRRAGSANPLHPFFPSGSGPSQGQAVMEFFAARRMPRRIGGGRAQALLGAEVERPEVDDALVRALLGAALQPC